MPSRPAATRRAPPRAHQHRRGISAASRAHPPPRTARSRPDGIYEVTKAAGDAIALEEAKRPGLEIVVIRPAPVYGPGDTRLVKLFRLASTPRPMLLGDGHALYHMVHIDDLVEAFLLAGERPEAAGQAFIIAGAERPSVNELVAVIARTLGRPEPRPLHLPAAPVRLLAPCLRDRLRPAWPEAADLPPPRRLLPQQPPVRHRQGPAPPGLSPGGEPRGRVATDARLVPGGEAALAGAGDSSRGHGLPRFFFLIPPP